MASSKAEAEVEHEEVLTPPPTLPSATMKEKGEAIGKLMTMMRAPENARATRGFVYASVAMFAVPLLVYFTVFTAMSGGNENGGVPSDILLNLSDPPTVAGLCAVAATICVAATFTVWAFVTDAQLDSKRAKQKAE